MWKAWLTSEEERDFFSETWPVERSIWKRSFSGYGWELMDVSGVPKKYWTVPFIPESASVARIYKENARLNE